MRHSALLLAVAVVVGGSPASAQDLDKAATVETGAGYVDVLRRP
jgi:hypothetical protein